MTTTPSLPCEGQGGKNSHLRNARCCCPVSEMSKAIQSSLDLSDASGPLERSRNRLLHVLHTSRHHSLSNNRRSPDHRILLTRGSCTTPQSARSLMRIVLSASCMLACSRRDRCCLFETEWREGKREMQDTRCSKPPPPPFSAGVLNHAACSAASPRADQ